MGNYLVRRLLQSLAVLGVMSIVVFVGVYEIGDPVLMMISPDATPGEIARTRTDLGLDQPLPVQYLRFLKGALSGDLGRSYAYSTPAISLILERLPATLELAVVAMALALSIGIPLGLWAGLRPRSAAGRVILSGSIIGFSLPSFWVGLLLIMTFAVSLGWLPASGRGATVTLGGVALSILTADGWRHLILPAANLALFNLALVIRMVRSGSRDALAQEYVRFARAKGLSLARIMAVHVLKNILIPIVTVVGLEFGSMIGFSVVTESIFAWPGMGKLIIDSINVLDRPIIVAYILVVLVLIVAINLVVDIAYALLDPRVRLSDVRT